MHTDRKGDTNKPDITIKDQKNNSGLLVELIFPIDKSCIWGIWKNIKVQGPGNRNRTNVAPKTTFTCGRTW